MVYAIDMDGTLCNEVCWNADQIKVATPRQDIIDKVNELYKSHFIVIHTARRHDLYKPTIDWLSQHNVSYHSICMEKMASDCYVDDKSIKPEDL